MANIVFNIAKGRVVGALLASEASTSTTGA